MKKNGFIVTSLLYPILVMITGILAVFLSMGKTNTFLNQMKLDTKGSIFDSVTCDCEVINHTLKTLGERIENINQKVETIKNKQSILSTMNFSSNKVTEINTIQNAYYLLFRETGSNNTITGGVVVLEKVIGTNRIVIVKATGNKITMAEGYYYAKVSG